MRKPSAALVVATTALVMATIGTSIAATGYTITSSKQVKPGAISLANLSKSARKALHGARGPAGPQGETGDDGYDGYDGEDGEDATNLWAQIKADGSVNASSLGVTAMNRSTGVYYVNFGQDITSCTALATQGTSRSSPLPGAVTTGIPGAASVSLHSAGADFAAGFPSVSSVEVATHRLNGTNVLTSFMIAVFC